jgi:hypothetical protein
MVETLSKELLFSAISFSASLNSNDGQMEEGNNANS